MDYFATAIVVPHVGVPSPTIATRFAAKLVSGGPVKLFRHSPAKKVEDYPVSNAKVRSHPI